jgi:hypothetical protein
MYKLEYNFFLSLKYIMRGSSIFDYGYGPLKLFCPGPQIIII